MANVLDQRQLSHLLPRSPIVGSQTLLVGERRLLMTVPIPPKLGAESPPAVGVHVSTQKRHITTSNPCNAKVRNAEFDARRYDAQLHL